MPGVISGSDAEQDFEVDLMTPPPQSEYKGELEYGSILPNGGDWRLRKFDAGMGEIEYRIFRNEVFFAQFDNRKDADIVMVAMTCPTESISHTQCYKTGYADGVSSRDTVLDEINIKLDFIMSYVLPKSTTAKCSEKIAELHQAKAGAP